MRVNAIHIKVRYTVTTDVCINSFWSATRSFRSKNSLKMHPKMHLKKGPKIKMLLNWRQEHHFFVRDPTHQGVLTSFPHIDARSALSLWPNSLICVESMWRTETEKTHLPLTVKEKPKTPLLAVENLRSRDLGQLRGSERGALTRTAWWAFDPMLLLLFISRWETLMTDSRSSNETEWNVAADLLVRFLSFYSLLP